MKYVEPLLAAGVFAGRLVGLLLFGEPATRWPADCGLVLSLTWLALSIARERPRLRTALVTAACLWLLTIYAVYQGPHTFWLFKGP